MTRPTQEELTHALDAAEKLRDQDMDDQLMGRSLLYLAQRNQVLEALLRATELYFESGQDPEAHEALLEALDAVRQQSDGPAKQQNGARAVD